MILSFEDDYESLHCSKDSDVSIDKFNLSKCSL